MWSSIVAVAAKVILWVLDVAIKDVQERREAKRRFLEWVDYVNRTSLASRSLRRSYQDQRARLDAEEKLQKP